MRAATSNSGRATALLCVVLLAGLAGLVLGPTRPAAAASSGWADLTFEGSANDWSGTLRQRAVGFPEATISSDSAGGSSVGRQTGSSTYLSASSPVGKVYGSSKSRPYLNLRPYTANGSGQPGSSTTTYRFADPTPAAGWTFVLGDVDADEVTVSATGPGGVPVRTGDLGFRSAFNYCGAGSCVANDDVPSWDESTATLTGNDRAIDTNGAAAWFEPEVPLSTLTLVFTRRAGFPVFQTAFASLSHTLSGTVSAPASAQAGLVVRLFAPDGRQVDEVEADADGRYRFTGLATYEDYRVALAAPDDLISDEPLSRAVDLSRTDEVVDFTFRELAAATVSGTVRDADGTALPGVVVRLSGNGVERTAVADADGGYVFDEIPVGAGYTLTATAPEGTTASSPQTFSVVSAAEDPITDQDFTITSAPLGALGGTVTTPDGDDIAEVEVAIVGSDGIRRTATTDADGRWSLTDLPPGRYTATVVPPEGSTVVGDTVLDVTIPERGGTIDDLDHVLALPPPPATYTARGVVVDEAEMAFPGVTVTVRDPAGQVFGTATTGEDGRWQVDSLLPGQAWSAAVTPPDGYEPEGSTALTFAVTDADTRGLDFSLVRTSSAGGAGSGGSSSGSPLAATGGPDLRLVGIGLVLTAGGGLVLRRRRRQVGHR